MENKQNTLLTYEEWKEKYMISITSDVVDDLKKFHDIDAYTEIENAMKKEYEFYAKGGYEDALVIYHLKTPPRE